MGQVTEEKSLPGKEYFPLCVYLDWSHYVLLNKSGLKATAVLLLWHTYRLDCCCRTSNQEVSGAAILWLPSSPWSLSRQWGGLVWPSQFYLHTVWFVMMHFEGGLETVSVKRCSMCTSERGQRLFVVSLHCLNLLVRGINACFKRLHRHRRGRQNDNISVPFGLP